MVELLSESEVKKEMSMMNAVVWDLTPFGPRKNRGFGGTLRLHLQGEENQRAKNSVIRSALGLLVIANTVLISLIHFI
jgi:hypothetical protein